jgi:hypothetical protein
MRPIQALGPYLLVNLAALSLATVSWSNLAAAQSSQQRCSTLARPSASGPVNWVAGSCRMNRLARSPVHEHFGIYTSIRRVLRRRQRKDRAGLSSRGWEKFG